MRKTGKLLSALLALALVLCLLPMTALADDDITSWSALQTAITNAGGTEASPAETPTTIKLTQDLTAASGESAITIGEGQNITLDLNGKTLDRGLTSETYNGYVIINYGTLTIKDSGGGGKITGGNNGYGNGGGVCNWVGATLTLESGSITGNKAMGGGGVYNYSGGGKFTMTGGSITNNTGIDGGGGVYNSGTFTMTGGFITGNSNTAYGGGGGVYNNGTGTFTLGGTAVVMGNKKGTGESETANDVENNSGRTITISTETVPAAEMYVGLIGDINISTTTDYSQYFFADEAGKFVGFGSDKLSITDIPGSSGPNNYKITLAYNPEGGYITAPQYEAEYANVEVKVNPAVGYQLKSLKVGNTTITETAGAYKFNMPEAAVTVTAEFEKHTHSFAETWTSDETNHWHAATCGHDVKSAEGAHVDNNHDHNCDTCGYVMSEHTYVDGVCTVCGAKEPESFDFDGLIDGIFGLIRFKKTTDNIKTFSILAVILEFVKKVFSMFFGN